MSISTVNGIQLGDLSPYVSDNRLMVKKEQDTFDNVLSAAIAATVCTENVTVLGAECVKKSYPKFWEEYARLGGNYEFNLR